MVCWHWLRPEWPNAGRVEEQQYSGVAAYLNGNAKGAPALRTALALGLRGFVCATARFCFSLNWVPHGDCQDRGKVGIVRPPSPLRSDGPSDGRGCPMGG